MEDQKMKMIVTNILLVIALVAGSIIPAPAQTAEQLYQKGLMKEEGEGSLREAIDLYNQIAENSSAGISLRAKALLHIGLCFEKLGTEEAVKAYQRLIKSYPSQKNEVTIAMICSTLYGATRLCPQHVRLIILSSTSVRSSKKIRQDQTIFSVLEMWVTSLSLLITEE
jgi:outer membrane protein assembly factor BamD (BamD/ComL family)